MSVLAGQQANCSVYFQKESEICLSNLVGGTVYSSHDQCMNGNRNITFTVSKQRDTVNSLSSKGETPTIRLFVRIY